MQIVKDLVSSSKYDIKCPYEMTPTRIVVHNTANDASAENEITYMKNNDNQVSFHFAVDDVEVRQGIPTNRNAWHCGDGANGKGNREGIAIEICYSKSSGDKFTKAEQNASKFIAQLLKEYGWGIDKVTKHQDYSNKYCPHRTLDLGWQRFLDMINAELDQEQEIVLEDNYGVEPYSGYIKVIYAGSEGLSYRSKPTWESSAVAGTVTKNTILTVIGRIKVDGVYMYQTKAGWYITSAKEYVAYSKDYPSSASNVSYYAKYTGTSASIVTALNSLGINSTYAYREKIAKANGISNYSGTAEQNTDMLDLLKKGKLKRV